MIGSCAKVLNPLTRLNPFSHRGVNLKTMRAYHIRLNFQELWNQTLENAEAFLEKWYFWATHSRLEPIKQAAYTNQTSLEWYSQMVQIENQ